MTETTKRVREMQLLGLFLDQSDKLKLDHTSIRRIGKYLINLANNEHAELVRDGSKMEIEQRTTSLRLILELDEKPEVKIELIKHETDLMNLAHARWTESVKTV